ncbi:glycosyltransferase family 2 protein [Synechococcus sp. CS-1325]|uniref:glycosyltransferase family 2 protein n=1 Tax=Synechococcus sp. CS-1325 TaxID=2847979 RepID=UPI00223B686E|nr:glycosyltransferase family 2 protein [Synechococcus sp. CS-1325]MCT0198162.1 glycosyltransferase family 2 protein [Synechococcus sp. CS-1325]
MPPATGSPFHVNTANTPLLLIAWRRPQTLRQVIDAIRPVAPMRLFVACDGPNPERPGEAEKVAATRQVIEQEIDWPCQIERLYSEGNQGCRLGVSRAISWFFEQVEEGIILEDDCVPHPDFFPYCATLLERYRHDSRVWCISGDNFQNGQWRGDGSYYFSRYNHCWGWASWHRCWQHYDAELQQWPALRNSGLLESIYEDPLERQYWIDVWQRLVDADQPDTWDYQWTFACLANSGLTALPNRNLVSNVGFGADGTHTTGVREPTVADQGLGTLKHPSFLLRDAQADRYTFDHHFGGAGMRPNRSLLPRVKARLRHHWNQLQSAPQ